MKQRIDTSSISLLVLIFCTHYIMKNLRNIFFNIAIQTAFTFSHEREREREREREKFKTNCHSRFENIHVNYS